MRFPDSEKAIAEVVGDMATTVSHLPKDLSTKTPLIQVIPIPSPGAVEPFLRMERLQINVFALGRTQAKGLAESVMTLLDGKAHQTSHGLLDLTEVVSLPSEESMEDDSLNQFTLSLNIHTRPLKEV